MAERQGMSQTLNTKEVFPGVINRVSGRNTLVQTRQNPLYRYIDDIRGSIGGLIFGDDHNYLDKSIDSSAYNELFRLIEMGDQDKLYDANNCEGLRFFDIEDRNRITKRLRWDEDYISNLFEKITTEIITSIESTGTFGDDYTNAYSYLIGSDEKAEEIDTGYNGPYLYPEKIKNVYKRYLIKELSSEIVDLFDMTKLGNFLSSEEMTFLHEEIEKRSKYIPKTVSLKDTVDQKYNVSPPIWSGFLHLPDDKKQKISLFKKIYNIQGEVYNSLDYNTKYRSDQPVLILASKGDITSSLISKANTRFGFDIFNQRIKTPIKDNETIAV